MSNGNMDQVQAGEPFMGGVSADNMLAKIVNEVDFSQIGTGAAADAGTLDSSEETGAAGAELSPQTAAEPSAPGEAGATETGVEGAEPERKSPFGEPVRPPVVADSTHYAEQFNKVSEALDQRFLENHQQTALEGIREDYGHYIDRLEMHPMELLGVELPPIDGSDKTVSFNTVQDVRDWQEAVQTVLRRDVQARVDAFTEEDQDVRSVIQDSIQLFVNNPDLNPKSSGFNKELADEVARIARPYALKMDGKLTGYSIPIQGIVDQVRASQANRAAPATASAPVGKKPTKPAERPQAGVQSKAGTSQEGSNEADIFWGLYGINQSPV